MRWYSLIPVGILVGLGVQGCAVHGCNEIGGINGVTLEISRALFVSTGDVTITVCDEGACGSTTQHLGKMSRGTPTPVGRGATATFGALGREFRPGRVTVTVDLRGPNGALVASRQQTVSLARLYPNGQDCDGEFVSGFLKIAASDRV